MDNSGVAGCSTAAYYFHIICFWAWRYNRETGCVSRRMWYANFTMWLRGIWKVIDARLAMLAGVDGWIPVEMSMPDTIGCYLCYTNDGWQLVGFVNVLGQWMLRPGGNCYGDLCGADSHLGKDRKVTHWRRLPNKPI